MSVWNPLVSDVLTFFFLLNHEEKCYTGKNFQTMTKIANIFPDICNNKVEV